MGHPCPDLRTFSSEWSAKAWGRCRTLFTDHQTEIIECEIEAGGYSSVHKHLHKDNSFFVLSGEVELVLYPGTMRPDRFTLGPSVGPLQGFPPLVLPCVPHQFQAVQKSRLIEIYRAMGGVDLQAGEGDIVRFSDGGMRK